jgi:hypothetical protein
MEIQLFHENVRQGFTKPYRPSSLAGIGVVPEARGRGKLKKSRKRGRRTAAAKGKGPEGSEGLVAGLNELQLDGSGVKEQNGLARVFRMMGV